MRNFREIHVYSPNTEHRNNFADRIEKVTGILAVAEESSSAVAEISQVLILATTSSVPVIKAGDIAPGTHIISVGRKSINEHELDHDVADLAAVVATDSLDQINSYDPPHFMSGSKTGGNIVELADVVSGKKLGRISRDDITLFLSVGLSGTEVALANLVLESSGRKEP